MTSQNEMKRSGGTLFLVSTPIGNLDDMTFRAVNDMKGQRTAMQFMKECAGKDVPGTNLQIQPLADFKKWVEAHRSQKLRRGFSKEDQARCKRRAELLLVERYEERNADFTEREYELDDGVYELEFTANGVEYEYEVNAFNGKVLEDGKVLPLDVKVGDMVLFGKYSGQTVKVDGEELLVMHESDVMAIVEQ